PRTPSRRSLNSRTSPAVTRPALLCACGPARYNGEIAARPPLSPELTDVVMKIVQYPHPALRFHAKPLTAIDKKVRLDAGRMLELMYEAHGIGLAATQVALTYQMFVLNPAADPNNREREGVYINPVLLERKGTIEGEEGCLSFPGLFQKVRRAKTVKVQA